MLVELGESNRCAVDCLDFQLGTGQVDSRLETRGSFLVEGRHVIPTNRLRPSTTLLSGHILLWREMRQGDALFFFGPLLGVVSLEGDLDVAPVEMTRLRRYKVVPGVWNLDVTDVRLQLLFFGRRNGLEDPQCNWFDSSTLSTSLGSLTILLIMG